MNKLVSDRLIEEIEIKPVENRLYFNPVDLCGSLEIQVVTSSINFFGLSEVNYVASGVLDQEGIDVNGTGFRYPTDELDPGEEPLEGVEIYNPSFGEAQLSISAFEKLMARYFRAVIEETEKQVKEQKPDEDVTQKPWWTEFVRATEQIEQRLQREN